MQPCSIREVKDSEQELLRQMAVQTFVDAFGQVNSTDNMALYLQEKFAPYAFAADFHAMGSEYYFIEYPAPVGYLKLNRGTSQTEPVDDGLEVERIYVMKGHQNKGLGRKMLDFAFKRARELGLRRTWLGVWEQNTAAIRLYERMGFTVFGKHKFLLGKDQQVDILMQIDL